MSNHYEDETIVCHTDSVEATTDLGRRVGQWAAELHDGICIALIGDLGTGKTHFSQGIALGYGVMDDVTSPTFALMNTYEGTNGPLYHFDLYRLEDESELDGIGFYEFTEDTVSIVEWADKFPDALPDETIFIEITRLSDTERTITLRSDYVSTTDLEKLGGHYVFGN